MLTSSSLLVSPHSPMRIPLVLLALAACGGDDAARALALADASKVANLSTWNIQWVSDGDLAREGHPDLVGFTDTGTRTIWISERHPSMLVHEALHVVHPDEPNHCTWSLRLLSVHMMYDVQGSFTDGCNQVLCASQGDGHYWSCSR
jgi:hypothetical protein